MGALVLLTVFAGLGLVAWSLRVKNGPGIDRFVPGVILMQALGGIRQYAAPFFVVALALQLPHWISLLAVSEATGARPTDRLLFVLEAFSALAPFALQGALGFGCSAPLGAGRSPADASHRPARGR